MAAGEAVAFVELQHRAGDAIGESGVRRLQHEPRADRDGPAAATRKTSGQRPHLRLLHAGGDRAEAIEQHELRLRQQRPVGEREL